MYTVRDENGDILHNPPEPRCRISFCEYCGDCIYCYGDGDCIDGNIHVWFQAKTRSKPMSRSYYVCHKVPSMTGQKEHISGPYETLLEAVYHYQDIKGYEHVEDVGIIMESDKPILDTE